MMHAGGLRFWLVLLVALTGISVTAALGQWQLSRAAEKRALQAALDERAALPPLDGAVLTRIGSADTDPQIRSLVHRSVRLEGTWLSAHTVYLDNRQMNGRPGFFVVTPFRLSGSNTAVLVQRGWTPRDFQDRTRVPDVPTPGGTVQIEGRLALAPSRLYEFSGSDGIQGSSRIRQNLDLATYGSETGLTLVSLSVLQTSDADDRLLREWPVIASGVDKHYGYAFQWFGLSSLIALLYVWFQIIRRFTRSRRPSAP